jgi:hypothetical protein
MSIVIPEVPKGLDDRQLEYFLDRLKVALEQVVASEEYVNDAVGGATGDHGELTGLTDDDHPQYLLVDGTRALTGEGLNFNNAIQVTQASHGFTVGQAVYFNGTSWVLAQADAESTAGNGLVSEVVNGNIFNMTTTGYITGLSGITAGTTYYVSDSTPGALATSAGAVSRPILFALTTSTGIVLPAGGGSVSRDFLSAYDSVNLQYLYTGQATPGTATSAASWRITRFNMATSTLETAASGAYTQIWDNREALSYS